jgi:hypothetical protein
VWGPSILNFIRFPCLKSTLFLPVTLYFTWAQMRSRALHWHCCVGSVIMLCLISSNILLSSYALHFSLCIWAVCSTVHLPYYQTCAVWNSSGIDYENRSLQRCVAM